MESSIKVYCLYEIQRALLFAIDKIYFLCVNEFIRIFLYTNTWKINAEKLTSDYYVHFIIDDLDLDYSK